MFKLNEYPTYYFNKVNDFDLDLKVYRKPTQTGLIFSVTCLDKWKGDWILRLLNIGKRICSYDYLFNKKVIKLRNMFKLNGIILHTI